MELGMLFGFWFCIGLIVVGTLIVISLDRAERKEKPLKVRHYFMYTECHGEMTFDWNCGYPDGIWHCLNCNHVDGYPKIEVTETEHGNRFIKYVGEDE
jgi:hypothetical protein